MNKPDLTMYFAQMPLIGKYMQFDYESANSLFEMIELYNKWMNEAEETKNSVRKINFEAGSKFLYTLLTGKSYESKNIELLVKKL